MATIYAAALRTTRMNAIVSAIGATGFLVIGDSTLNGAASASVGVLAKIPLAATAGVVAGDVLTLSQPITVSATGAGTAAKAEIWNTATPVGAANVTVTGLTVGTSGANINLGTTTIAVGNTVTVSPATITHATT